jgi:hypothetical protein
MNLFKSLGSKAQLFLFNTNLKQFNANAVTLDNTVFTSDEKSKWEKGQYCVSGWGRDKQIL